MTNTPQPNDLSHLSDEEFHALCPIGEHAPGPEPLSPAAQAVMDAINNTINEAFVTGTPATFAQVSAAALRAAVEQVEHCRDADDQADRLLDIAAELKGHHA